MSRLRKTRIVCTLGPAVDSVEAVEHLLRAGMNVARLNFSHGTHQEHQERIGRAREASRRTGLSVAFMVDTKGPEIRTGRIEGDGDIELRVGNRITLTTEEVPGNAELLSVSYRRLPDEVRPGSCIFIADGLIELEVVGVLDKRINCVVRSGGTIGSRKNVNVPGVRTSLPAVTAKDREDIAFAADQGLDFVAASFVRRPENVAGVKDLLSEYDSPMRVIAKIEDQEGLENVDEIIRVSDGVMVARGDLGVQLSIEQIPMAQKRIIDKCNRSSKPVITATQMLDSMIYNPHPTRAELTDVANAIFDGTDAVMLSGETAGGKYPVESVKVLDRIALAVESSEEYVASCARHAKTTPDTPDIGYAVAKSAFSLAQDVGAAAIITPTLRGNSPRMLSRFRPKADIIAATVSETVQRQLLLHWGVIPVLTELVNDSDQMIQNSIRQALAAGYVKRLDRVVTAAGIPVNSPIMMNTVKVHFLGNILSRGHSGFGGVTSGRVVKCGDRDEAYRRLAHRGDEVLLVRHFEREYLDTIQGIGAVISEDKSPVPFDEIRESNPNLVFVSELPGAYAALENGLHVSVDGEELIVYEGVIGPR